MRTGRPRRVDDAAIFDALSALVTEVGPAGLTLGALGDRVGLSAPALSQRFGSKRNLLLAYARSAAGAVDEHFARARAASGTPLSALLAALVGFSAGLGTRAAVTNNLAFLHLDLTDPDLGAQAASQSRLLRGAIASLVEEAIADGDLDAAEPHELADTIYTVYNGALITWAIDGRGSVADWLTERLARVIGSARPPRSSGRQPARAAP